ncbi:MAG: hypothetical protein U0802_01355 [Candidatus Binatia bacterium]
MITSVALGLVISFMPHEARRHEAATAGGGPSILTPFSLWRVLFVGLALLGYTLWAFFQMKAYGASGPAGAHRRRQRHHHGPGLLPAEQPLPGRLVALAARPPRQPYLPLGIGAVVVLQPHCSPTRRRCRRCSTARRCRCRCGRCCSPAAWCSSSPSRPRKLLIRSNPALRRIVTKVEAGAVKDLLHPRPSAASTEIGAITPLPRAGIPPVARRGAARRRPR